MSADKIGREARAFNAADRTVTHAAGVIVAYCDRPQYLIQASDGSRFWWRADLTEVKPSPGGLAQAMVESTTEFDFHPGHQHSLPRSLRERLVEWCRDLQAHDQATL